MGCIPSKKQEASKIVTEEKVLKVEEKAAVSAKESSQKVKNEKRNSGDEKSSTKGSFRSQYTLGKELGKGNYSTVRMALRQESKETVAVKCIKDSDLTREDRDALKFEIEILRKLDHPNIIKFYDFFTEKPTYYIVMEFVEGGELFDRIVEKEYYSERDAARVIKTVGGALKYCHDRGIVHRDLKPENLLLTKNEKGVIDDGNIKLADFGFAKSVKDNGSGLTTSCGTPGYVAPEILQGKVYGKEVDLWSLGVILYILLCGYPPFLEDDSTGQRGLFEKIKRGSYSFTPKEYWQDVSEEAKELIKKLLVVDPKKRLTIEELLKEHWVNLGEEATDSRNITAALAKLKQYQARKKWKMGINAVTAANRISHFVSQASRGEEKDSEAEVESHPEQKVEVTNS